MNMKPRAIAAAMVASSLGIASYAGLVSLVSDGGFTNSTYTANSQFDSGANQGGRGVTGWTSNNGYELYFTSAAAASTVNATGRYSRAGKEKLYGTTGVAGTVPHSAD